ncbi:hypothetical protein, partial [Bacillus cereus]|uniref:hypothetical protein n=1 Tax=Bacillus cereus TaxID=1396 RepID=UPI003C1302E8
NTEWLLLSNFIYIPAFIIDKTTYIRGKIKRKTFWLRQTEIHLPPTSGYALHTLEEGEFFREIR